MKKVVLLYPKTGWDVKNVTILLPLSVMLLGRPLRRAGYTPVVIDMRIDPRWEDTLRAHLAGGDVMAVGVSAMTGLQIRGGLVASAMVRKLAPDVPIVWGGIHPALMPIQTVEHPLVDYVVWGEGESALIELMNALDHEAKPTAPIPGVTYLDAHGVPVHGPKLPFIDLGEALVPDYDLVNVDDYFTTQTLGERDLAIVTSRGCPSRCSFCYNVAYASRRWRAQPPEAVVDHVEYIVRRYGINAILIKDDNFYVSKKRVEQIAQGFRARGIKVVVRGECRADYISNGYSDELLRDLYDNGFQEMTVGAESGTDMGLSLLLKDLKVDDIYTASEKLGRARIATKFTFMAGFPGETWETIKDTLRLMTNLVRDNPYARTTPMHLYAPYPGTPLFDDAVKGGWNAPATLEGWADVDFHQCDLPWIDPKVRKVLERISLSTYFLDGRTMPEYFSKSKTLSWGTKLYGSVVRWRAERTNFRFMPELWLMEQYRRMAAEA